MQSNRLKTVRLLSIALSAFILVGLVLGSAGSGSGAQAAEPLASGEQKVIAPAGVLDPNQDGVRLWHDYGSFALYAITNEALESLPASAREKVQLSDDLDMLLFDAYPFNTQSGNLDLPAGFSLEAPAGPALQVIQFVGPLKESWLEAVQAAGAELVHYIANNGYLVWADASARARLGEMVAEGDFLQYIAFHQPYLKIGPTLRSRIEAGSDPDEIVDVEVQIFRHAGQQASEQAIRGLSQETLADWSPILAFQNAILRVRVGDVAEIAGLADVTWVGERLERELMDEVQGQIMAGNLDGSQSGPSAPGYLTWLSGFGFSTDPSQYPIVDVTDDGIGNGTVNSGDPTLHVSGSLANPTRLAYVANCTNSPSGEGVDGHGHINVSIAGGYDTTAGFPNQDPGGYQRGLGINPYGRFAGTRIFDPGFDQSSCGGTDTGVIQSIQDNGAQINTNSWGCAGCAGTYDASSQAYDVGTRDADLVEAGNQEMIMVFSAGNSGPGAGTVGTPGNGKNMITVGASENDRPSDEDGAWTDGCGIGPTGADNAMDVISFSSRGPSPGSRVKPEVIGPGTHVQGTASTNAGYTGFGVCDQFRPSGQTTFAASSGTSHSTPAVAGVSSLAWWWLENQLGISTPSPAVMKAFLIAHPTYLTGVSANDTLPSNNQGYGMPNMGLMFDNTPKYLVDQTVIFDNSGETWMWSGAVADPSKPVRIVLAYTDQAGAIGTSPQVNNLNLAATVGGSSYLGNVFSGQWSMTGGVADGFNNYEAIFLPAGTTGTIDLTVTAFNIAGDGVPNTGDGTDQDFAIVCYNCASFPDFSLDATPDSLDICTPNDALYTVDVGQILGFTDPVTLSAIGNPAGTTTGFSVNPVTPPGSSVLTIGNTGAAANGSYDIDIVGTAVTSTHTTTVQLNVFDAVPGGVTLTTPVDGATDVESSPTFMWTAATQASTYDLEVAADSGFSTVVYTATVAGTSHTMSGGLAPGTTYYWRVRANNGCGQGTYSATFSFTTSLLFCSAPGVAIPDNGQVTDVMSLSGAQILDLNVSLDTTHTWVGDLIFTLEHLDTGTSVTIFDRPGVPGSTFGCSGNDIDAVLDDEALNPVEDECGAGVPTIQGSFIPNNPLSGFDLENLSGDWQLTVSDNAGGDLGTLNEWCLVPVLASAVGTLQGTVTDNDTGLGLLGATVTAQGTGAPQSTVTNPSGHYTMTLGVGNYDVTAEATNYLSVTVSGVSIITGTTTIQDFALQGSSLTYTPPSIEEFMTLGEVVTNTVTLTNTGPLPIDWSVNISGWAGPRTVVPSISPVSIPASDGNFARGAAAPSVFSAPARTPSPTKESESGTSGTGLDNLFGGVQAFGVDLLGTNLVSFDLASASTLNVIAAASGAYYAGDFLNGDFTMLYSIDNSTSTLYAIDTATGAPTSIGPVAVASGETWTGMAGDPTTGTMYASSSNCATNTLYTVDVTTGTSTVVGPSSGVCIISIAINAAGDMYGVDIIADQLLSIDKTTGAVTPIGPLGFDANFAQGLDFDEDADILYLAAYNNAVGAAELRTADLTTGATALVSPIGPGIGVELDSFGIATGGGAQWASAVPDTGTIPANSTATFEVVFDSNEVGGAGTYTAQLDFSGNFVNMVPTMPLTMHVTLAGVELNGPTAGAGKSGTQVVYSYVITNTGLVTDTFSLSLSGNSWTSNLSTSSAGPLVPGEATTFTLTVDIPTGALPLDSDTVTLTAVSGEDALVQAQLDVTTTVPFYPLYLPIIPKE